MIKLMRKKEIEEVVEIELPYYFKHDLMIDELDSVVYGKIEERRITTIQISHSYSEHVQEYELRVENNTTRRYGCYTADKYKSSEAEYTAAKNEFLAAVKENVP